MRSLAVLCLILCSGAASACVPGAAAVPMVVKADAPLAYLTAPVPPVSQPFEIELQFCDRVTDVSVRAIMPAHQHGMSYLARIQAHGDGHFTVSGMVFHLPGRWQIQVSTNRATYTHDKSTL